MFGLLALGFFTALALNKDGNGFISGTLTGITASLIAMKAMKEAWGDLFPNKDKDDEDDEDDEKSVFGTRHKIMHMMQNDIKSHDEDDPASDEVKQARDDYETFIKCAYDEDGNERSQDNMQKSFNELSEDKRKRLTKSFKKAIDDKSLRDNFSKSYSDITSKEAAEAASQGAADRVTYAKRDKIKELEAERDKKIKEAKQNGDDEEAKKIEEEYKDKIAKTSKEYDKKIDAFKSQTKKISEEPGISSQDEIIQAKKAENKKLEKEKERILKDKNWASDQLDKYRKFSAPDFKAGNLTDPNVPLEDKQAAEQILKDAGLDPKLYVKIANMKKDTNPDWDKIKTSIAESKEKKLNEIEKKIKENNVAISKAESGRKALEKPKPEKAGDVKGDDKANDNKTDSKPKKKGVKKKEVPEYDEDGDDTGGKFVATKDADGNVTYKYIDKDGVEKEASKDDFNKASETAAEFEDDVTDEEDDQTDNTKKSKNPTKIWHKRKNKRTGRTTKNYYNSKGDSISPKDFKQRVKSYHKKKQNESLSTRAYNHYILEHAEDSLVSFLKVSLRCI